MAESGVTVSVREYIQHEAKKSFFINVILNAIIPYAMLYSLTEVTAWGDKGYGKDLILTAFILCAILAGVFIAITRKKHKQEEIIAQGNEGTALAWLIPYNPWLAALWIGILGICLAVPPLLGVLALLEINTLSPLAYSAIKGLWAGAMAVIVVTIAIRQGMRTQPAEPAT